MAEETTIPTESNGDWIWAHRPEGMGKDYDPENSGKWIVWFSEGSVDWKWGNIKKAVERGNLGPGAKIKKTKLRNAGGLLFVTCVYTYHWQDEPDVMRVRQGLRELGVHKIIKYKADEDTRDFLYGDNYEPKYQA